MSTETQAQQAQAQAPDANVGANPNPNPQDVQGASGDQDPLKAIQLPTDSGKQQESATNAKNENEYEGTIKDLQTKLGKYKYPNKFVKELAQQFNTGKSPNEIKAFIDSNFTDFSAMPAAEVVKMGLRNTYPTLNAEEINTLFDQQYPNGDDEASNQIRNVKLKVAAIDVQKELEKHRVGFDPIGDEANDPAEDLRRAQTLNAWKSVSDQVVSKLPPRLQFATQGEAIGGAYEFNFNIPNYEQESAELTSSIVQYAMAAGLPFDDVGLKQIAQYRDNLLFLKHKDAFLKSMAEDMYASLADFFSKKYSGKLPSASQQGQAQKKGSPPILPGMV